MNESIENGPTRYRIGAVARLTGISPDALRIWERRYAAGGSTVPETWNDCA
jgi:hypothetical protein